MVRPRFSVVIPTRSRAETLHFTLQTCLNQSFDDYEIVVCDNCDDGATERVVKSFASKRIAYHRSPEPLSMRGNWELAYSLSKGEYVMFIGDDDGLPPYALSQLEFFLQRHNVQAITWDCAVYSWPNVGRNDLANHLQIPLSRRLRWIDGRPAIRDVLANRMKAHWLPNIYHGLVARTVLEDIRKTSGHLFGGYMVDTYTSFAVAYFAGRYAHLAAPISVTGFSKNSHNIALHFLRGKHPNAQRYREDNLRTGLSLHPWVPDLPTGWACIADSFLTAKEELFPTDVSMTFDRKGFVETLLKKPPINELSDWPEIVEKIRKSLKDDPKMISWFDSRIKRIRATVPPKETFGNVLNRILGSHLHIDAKKYKVSDVASAVSLMAKILPYADEAITWQSSELDYLNLSRRWRINRRIASAA